MDQQALLETLLHELKDGVIVCDPEARITLFNPAAEELFDRSRLLRQGQSLYKLCYRPPVEQALQLLDFQHQRGGRFEPLPYIQFLNKTIGRDRYVRCRVSFLASRSGGKNPFVLVIEDISGWYSPDNPLVTKIEEFRAPMTNLRAAVENLTDYPEMSPVMRSAFENVLVQETLNLAETFNDFAHACHDLTQSRNHLTELDTELFFSYLAHHLGSRNIPAATFPAKKLKVKVDVYGLLLLLDHLADKLGQNLDGSKLSCEAHAGDQFVFLDFTWPGREIASGAVKELLAEKVAHSLGDITVTAMLHTMEGDIWIQPQAEKKSLLRLALPIAAGP